MVEFENGPIEVKRRVVFWDYTSNYLAIIYLGFFKEKTHAFKKPRIKASWDGPS